MHVRRLLFAVAAVSAGLVSFPLHSAPTAEAPLPDKVDFNRDVRPIFAETCYQCHGPDKGHRKAGLRLDTREGIFGKDGGVVAGKPAESELYLRLVTNDADERMPQAESNKTLTPRQIALVKKWIEQGAEYKGHWAYAKPVRPEPPAAVEPGFVRNPVDRFVLAKLKEVGLNHAPEADRVTLIRRLSFDLTGLPPTRAEVEAFVADRSPDAYEKVVDRLLASPHYGERMAMYWLDLVRFADTIGYHSDNPMNVAPYRDYVIRSFNENRHFDRFTVEQLAGDLLPDATQEQRIASAYNRLLQTTEEGGAQPKEYEAKYAADRVRNVSAVWLGSTMGCCQCHDHKFDPFTLRDFYSLAAFFADVKEAAVGRREAGMPVPNTAQAAELKRLDAELVAARAALQISSPELAAAQAAWEREQASPHSTVAWSVMHPTKVSATRGAILTTQPDDTVKASGTTPDKGAYTVTARPALKGVSAVRLEVFSGKDLPASGPGLASNGNFVLTQFKVRAAGKLVKLARANADFSQDGHPVASAIDGKGGTGWAILPQVGKPHVVVFELEQPLADPDPELTVTLEFHSAFAQHAIGNFRLAVTASANPAGPLALPDEVKSALAAAADKRTKEQKKALDSYYRTVAPLLAPERAKVAELEKRHAELTNAIPKCLVTVTGPPRTVRVLARGNWLDDSGEVVAPAVPQSLGKLTSKDRLTRLDLARWIASADNPLTACVLVNRLWKLYFGQGLSKTLEDVGSQGEWPTHPELLDWLAGEFVARDWDVKAVVRLLVTSGTYRQSSQPTDRQKEVDPYNRYLARQSRFRLDAEVVRDNALAVSGLLNPQVGGASVFPYQPAGYWAALNFPTREWHNDNGDKLYRRGMYTHWQRSFPQPSLLAFDAPSREECTVDRPRSNIPQQALVLLNDPTYVEAARVFAERTLKEGGASPDARIVWAFTEVVSRAPTADEARVLAELYGKHKAQYAADRESAVKLVHTGAHPLLPQDDPVELAAWTSVARVLLNLHETVTRP
jgi:mono/diheme cytochrome c family protein